MCWPEPEDVLSSWIQPQRISKSNRTFKFCFTIRPMIKGTVVCLLSVLLMMRPVSSAVTREIFYLGGAKCLDSSAKFDSSVTNIKLKCIKFEWKQTFFFFYSHHTIFNSSKLFPLIHTHFHSPNSGKPADLLIAGWLDVLFKGPILCEIHFTKFF